METEIISLIERQGPLTGSEILEATGGDGFSIWRTCKLSQKLTVQTVGIRYLRLDRGVEGFARLSPSILREFLTFSVVGIQENPDLIKKKAEGLVFHIEEVSRAKLELAYRVVSGLASLFENEWSLEKGICFIIGGDIVYNMAHDVPRPERSTGKMVTGSDMDLVIIVDDKFPDDLIKKLDDAIYREKYRLLMAPHLKEEIDYIIKNLNRVREQVRFETFKHMVACKILHEGTLLYGSEHLFSTIKGMLREHGIVSKLNKLEKQARIFRRHAEEHLQREDPQKILDEKSCLFYPTEESEEFE
jgi:hypothetical protein